MTTMQTLNERNVLTSNAREFLGLDRLGVRSGSSNFRSYVGNDFPNATDLSGLQLERLTQGPEGYRIKLDAEPKEIGKANGGVVSASTGKLPPEDSMWPGTYLSYKGPMQDDAWWVQFFAVDVYIVDQTGKKIKNVIGLDPLKEPTNNNPALKNGIEVGANKNGQLSLYNDSFHPSGALGALLAKGTSASPAGNNEKWGAWTFDAPGVARTISSRRLTLVQKGIIAIQQSESLVVEMKFTTFLTTFNKKTNTFSVIGTASWSSTESIKWKNLGNIQLWAGSGVTVTLPVYQPGVPKNFKDYQDAYTNHLKQTGDKVGYKLVK